MFKRTMALSKSFDSFSCPVCSEILKSPKILPCLHTFCEQCIHEFILSTGRNKENEIKDFNCPVCRIVVKPKDAKATPDKWAATLKDNVIMNTALTMAHGDKSFECHACKRHEQISEAKFWCEQCYEAMCEKCNSMHSWMKLSMTHDVVQIGEVGCKTLGIDLRAVSEYCPMHPLKMVDVFCFQHKTACCGLCAGIHHRKCENVKTIEETVHSSGLYNTLLEKLNDIKESTKTVLHAKEQEKVKIKEIAENTEGEAANFIQEIRSTLDICFEAFKKQLTVFSEEQNTRLNVRIRLLEQLIEIIEHWAKVTEVVQTSGTILQLFVHVETVKQQIEASVKELQNLCSTDTDITIRFKKNDTLQKFESVEQIGFLSIENREIETNQLGEVFEMCSNLGICTQQFEDIRIDHIRTIHVPGAKLQCGVCIADNYILLGDSSIKQKSLHLVNKSTGRTISKTEITEDVKRLYFDKDLSRIFLSCYNYELCCADFEGEFIANISKMSINTGSIGALCRFNDYIYIIANGSIKKFIPSDLLKKMTNTFSTNTSSRGLNGITIWKEKIFYTTADKEIKCSSLDGRHIFTHKSDKMMQPVSIAMLSSDVVLFLDKNCSLHALSNDGKKHATLLEKFQKVVDPWDMWINIDDSTVYIAGGEYVDVYKIQFD